MTCTDVLTRLLEAEREELEGQGPSSVAVHVRECVRCRAVASQLLSDTRVLAAQQVAARDAATRSVRRAARRPVLWGGALAAAAGVAFFLMAGRRVPASSGVQAPALVHSNPGVVPAMNPASLVPMSRRAAVRATRLAEVAAATPVRFVASQELERPMPRGDASGVSVSPPAGTRAAVLATRNAGITVVWLYGRPQRGNAK
jgi:hypothetical protein